MAWCGCAWQGKAWSGEAWSSVALVISDLERVAMRSRSVPTAPLGTVWLGMVGQGPARLSLARLAMAWSYRIHRHLCARRERRAPAVRSAQTRLKATTYYRRG